MKLMTVTALSVLMLAPCAPTCAQTPVRVRGAVASLAGDVLTVKSRSGADVRITLAPDWRAVAVVPTTMDRIKPGTFVGVAAEGPEGNQRATEVVIFPEAMRGTGEGHYAWDLNPGSSMTNGNIDGEVAKADGRHLTIGFKSGSTQLTVPPDVPVVTLAPADRAAVSVGAKVFVPGQRDANGSVGASRVLVGEHGITPPM